MTQQLRYNQGKAKHSYFFACATALEKLNRVGNDDAKEPVQHVFDSIAQYLDGADECLAEGTLSLFAVCADDVAGDPVEFDEPLVLGLPEFLANHVEALEEFARVCDYGEQKYTRGNYRKGAPVTQYLDSALRHMLARAGGEMRDVESGCLHSGHALWNCMMALDQPEYRDDRLPPVMQEPVDDGRRSDCGRDLKHCDEHDCCDFEE